MHSETTSPVAPIERRQKRSDDPMVALHFQLARARSEGGMEAVVVADDDGLVVAAAGSWATCEELAAYAPLLVQGHWVEPGASEPSGIAGVGARVSVRPVEVDGQRMLLCACGGPRHPETRTETLDRAARGVARILAAA